MLLATMVLIGAELATPCPPGGPLAGDNCAYLRPLAVAVVGGAATLYVLGLSAVLIWTQGLVRRGAATARTARDWYLIAAVVGLVIMPLLSFTLVSAVR